MGDIFVQRDGKVVVVGWDLRRLILSRFNRDGTVDPSFGLNGTAVRDLEGFLGPSRAALDAAGRILVPDSPGCAPCPASVLRFAPDGHADATFGHDGQAFLPTRSARLHAVAAADERVVAAGVEWLSRRRLVVARLTPSGILDSSFGDRGLAFLPVARTTFVTDIAVQSNGSIVVLTTHFPLNRSTEEPDFMLTRLLPNGSVDRTFGAAGKATADFAFSDVGEALAIQPNGKLVVAGVLGQRPGLYRADAFGVARFLP